MSMKSLLGGLGVVLGGAVFAAMGWSMWVMKGTMETMGSAMSDMRANMGDMASYMKNMGANGGYMQTMTRDIADMRVYMLLMAGDAEQIREYREGQGTTALLKASPEEMAAVNLSCQEFLAKVGLAAGQPGSGLIDEVNPEQKRFESYMASMRRDMNEMDKHIFCMYLSMSADMNAMRESIAVMTPSVATMGPTMNYMGRDMNRGVNSFTSPMTYMFNALR